MSSVLANQNKNAVSMNIFYNFIYKFNFLSKKNQVITFFYEAQYSYVILKLNLNIILIPVCLFFVIPTFCHLRTRLF